MADPTRIDQSNATVQRHLPVVLHVLATGLAALAAQMPLWSPTLGLYALPPAALIVVLLCSVRNPWQTEQPGPGPSARALLGAGAAVLLVEKTPSTSTAIGASLGVALIVAGLVTEPYVRRAAAAHLPVVAHLPGILPAPQTRAISPSWLTWASTAAVAVGVLLGAFGASAWWWVAATALAGIVPGAIWMSGRARTAAARRLRRELPFAVAAYEPELVIYTARPDDASFQVLMWLPYVERAGMRYIIVTRAGEPARALAALTDAPVVEAPRIADLNALVVPSLKAALYVNTSSGNGAFIRFQHLMHIYVGHGDSDKPDSHNPTHGMFDQIFAAGPAAVRRYADHGVLISERKFRLVGRPQVGAVRPAAGSVGQVRQPTVLYAPTSRGNPAEPALSSLPRGEEIVSALLERGATVVFRPHPLSHQFAEDAAAVQRIEALLAADAARSGRAHIWGAAAEREREVSDCINESDALVSDVSAVVTDYLSSGKPFAMVAVPGDPETFAGEFPVAAASYVIRGDLANLGTALDLLLGDDPLAERRQSIRADYLGGESGEGCADAFVDAVRQVATKPMETIEEEPFEDEPEAATAVAAVVAEEQEAAGRDERSGREVGLGSGADLDGSSSAGEEDDPTDDAAGESAPPRAGRLLGYWRLIAGAFYDLLATGLALLCLFATLVGALAPAVACAVASLGAVAWSSRSTLRRFGRWDRLLDRAIATRSLLLMASAVLADRLGSISVPSVTAVTLLAIGLAAERPIAAAWRRVGAEVRNLPEVYLPTAQFVPRGLVTIIGGTLTLAGFLMPIVGLPGTPQFVLSALFLLISAEALARSEVRAARAIAAEAKVVPALTAYAPQFVVYFASTVGAAFQVGMWLPYFVRIGRPWLVVTRTPAMLREIEQVMSATGIAVPILLRPTLRSLEDVVVPSLRVAFYVNNAARNAHLVERRGMTHVWLNHGDSEKPEGYNPVHAIYDLIFSAGQAGVDRYVRHGVFIPREKFRIVGRPQVESIEIARGPVGEQRPPTVLYAPTWQGPFADRRVSSLSMGREIVSALLARGTRVIFRAHPFSYRYTDCVDLIDGICELLEADRALTGRDHRFGPAAESEVTIEDCFNASDAMISDVSEVLSDYLRSRKPFAIVAAGRTMEELVGDVPAAMGSYVIDQDLVNLETVLDDLLQADPLAPIRDDTRIYYLGDFPDDSYADGFLDAARRVIDGEPVAAEPVGKR